MKTKITIYLLLIFSVKMFAQNKESVLNQIETNDSTKAKSQKNDSVIIYDFAKGVYVNSNIKPKFGKPIVFKIININRIFFTPSIEGLSGVDADSLIGEKAMSETQSTKESIPGIVASDIKTSSAKNIILLDVKPIDDSLKKENEFINDDVGYDDKKYKDLGVYERYKKKLDALKAKHETFVYIINKINGNYNNYLDKINTPELTHKIYKILYEDSNNADKNFETSSLLDLRNFKKNYVKLNQYKEVKIEFTNFLQSDEIFQITEMLKKSGNGDAAKLVKEEVELLKKYVQKTDEDITKMNLHKKLNFVEILNRILMNENSYQYVSKPIQGFGDYLSFDVDIKEKKKLTDDFSIFQSNRKFTHKEFIRGGIRLDFGVGASFDFGEKDEKYSTIENDNGEPLLKQVNKGDYTPKLVGLLHASRRSSTNFAYGLSLGTSLDVANFDINSIYLGPSFLFGRTDKIIITAGPSFRNIKQLNSEYIKYTDEVLPAGFVLDDSKYVGVYKVGFFFAVTYNLTNKQRKNFIKATNNVNP